MRSFVTGASRYTRPRHGVVGCGVQLGVRELGSLWMKTIGVFGGLGPQATMDFEARVHRVAQELIAPNVNSGYPPMVVYYYRFVPFVATETGEPERPLRPDPRFLAAAAQIGRLADFLVVTSNFLHLFQAEIEQVTGCELLSMIDLTVAEVQRRRWRRVGVPGSAIRSCTRSRSTLQVSRPNRSRSRPEPGSTTRSTG